MKKYFEVALAGLFFLWPTLTASAEEPVQIVVAEQSIGSRAPVEATVQFDPGPRPMAADDGTDRLWSGHFVAGAGVYIIKPFFENNPAFTSVTNGVGPGTAAIQQHDFCWGLNAAPIVWLGYLSESGWGLRARWWLFDQNNAISAESDPNTSINSASPQEFSIATPRPIPGSPNGQIFFSSNLKVNVWDFEATRQAEAARWVWLFSAGFRYAHLSQDYRAFQALHAEFNPIERMFFPLPAGVSEVQSLSSGHNFNGAGPTVAVEVRRPISNFGLSLFANFRGTMLFGQSKQQVDRQIITQFFGMGVPVTNVSASGFESTHDTVLPVAELEMGVEYSRTWGAVRPFLRTGLVAQTWFDAGSASNLDGNLGFLGLSVTAGLNY